MMLHFCNIENTDLKNFLLLISVSILNFWPAFVCSPKYLICLDHLICTLESMKSDKLTLTSITLLATSKVLVD